MGGAVDDVLDGDRSSLEEASSTQSSLANTVNALKKRTVDDVIDARPLVQKAIGEPCSAASYAQALAGEQLEIVDSLGDHVFAAKSSKAPNAKALQKELKKLQRDLPEPSVDGSVFVRFDEQRLDLCRCVITGPVDASKTGGMDTPYAYGFLCSTSGFRRPIRQCRPGGNCYDRWRVLIVSIRTSTRTARSASVSWGTWKASDGVREMGPFDRFSETDPAVDPTSNTGSRTLLQRTWKGRGSWHIRG